MPHHTSHPNCNFRFSPRAFEDLSQEATDRISPSRLPRLQTTIITDRFAESDSFCCSPQQLRIEQLDGHCAVETGFLRAELSELFSSLQNRDDCIGIVVLREDNTCWLPGNSWLEQSLGTLRSWTSADGKVVGLGNEPVTTASSRVVVRSPPRQKHRTSIDLQKQTDETLVRVVRRRVE